MYTKLESSSPSLCPHLNQKHFLFIAHKDICKVYECFLWRIVRSPIEYIARPYSFLSSELIVLPIKCTRGHSLICWLTNVPWLLLKSSAVFALGFNFEGASCTPRMAANAPTSKGSWAVHTFKTEWILYQKTDILGKVSSQSSCSAHLRVSRWWKRCFFVLRKKLMLM